MREPNLSVCSRSRQIPNVSEKVKFSLFLYLIIYIKVVPDTDLGIMP